MMNRFNVNAGLVVAQIREVPNSQFFFAVNGEPHKIFCHMGQGGELLANRAGQFLINNEAQIDVPTVGRKIILVRTSDDPKNIRAFTKAAAWAYEEDWNHAKWALYAGDTFVAMAYDHRNGGHYQGNSDKEVELVRGKLTKLMETYPLGGSNDRLAENYRATLGKMTLSYKTRWYRIVDGLPIPHDCDPRGLVDL